MFTPNQVPAYLIEELPEIIIEFRYMYPSISLHKTFQCLVNFLSRRIMQNDLEAVKKCFEAAENLYCNGDEDVRTAIEKTLVYSFPALIELWNQEEKIDLQSVRPIHLNAYIQLKQQSEI